MNLSKQIFAYLKITRPLNVALTFFVVVVAILISKQDDVNWLIIFLASLSAAFTTASGNIINDIFDIETDRISHPNRALVLGVLTKKSAAIEYLLLNLFAIIIAGYLSIKLMLIVLISIIILFLYSYSFKKKPLIGNVTVAFLTGLAFIYGGIAAENPVAAIVPAVFAFLINLIREVVKDMQDVEGDIKAGVSTFPIKFGFQNSKIIIVISTIILIFCTLYPFITQLYKIEYFLIVMLFVNPLLILCIKYLFDVNKENKLSTVSNILKINMVLGLIAIYLGK
ncbi:MAG TPA: geranylgeranylglycerol-phosphate geranylgeranyltransferase [Ignavibacteriaceae bacterium]